MQPVSLRIYSGSACGHTSFFRNRPLLDTVLRLVETHPRQTLNVLFHACSIGAEPYSFVIASALASRKQFRCFATDRSADFLSYAQGGTYPPEILTGMTPAERAFFESAHGGQVRVAEPIRRCIQFLPAGSFSEFETRESFDIVFLLNALVYVDAVEQSRTLDLIASYNPGLLVTTAFHMDTVKRDLQARGYEPMTANIEAIHEGWAERRALAPGFIVPDVTYTSPALPAFSRIPDFEWKYGALFRKRSCRFFGEIPPAAPKGVQPFRVA